MKTAFRNYSILFSIGYLGLFIFFLSSFSFVKAQIYVQGDAKIITETNKKVSQNQIYIAEGSYIFDFSENNLKNKKATPTKRITRKAKPKSSQNVASHHPIKHKILIKSLFKQAKNTFLKNGSSGANNIGVVNSHITSKDGLMSRKYTLNIFSFRLYTKFSNITKCVKIHNSVKNHTVRPPPFYYSSIRA
ncbi:hypothetical protein [Chryseobacterium echinoideorum]|uniref:hypothetical protein n=1 Tax=Chryseobacterium echinoideorum TaxID=1549648 RepID=UPI001186ED3C|nr:hypothetical protein [Chryseobacterium echinoideorum]